MADTLALEKLYTDVVARFTTEGTTADQPFGWRQSARQGARARIVWIPGDANGNVGAVNPPRNPGRNPRPIGTLAELFTVEIHDYDPATPENELAQWKATRLLFDAWWRAVYLAAYGTVRIVSTKWVTNTKERRLGATLQVVCAIESMLPDSEVGQAPADTTAEITNTILETIEIETAP